MKYAKFEEHNGFLATARNVYERGMEFFGDEHTDEAFYMAFAKFEERQKEFERVSYNIKIIIIETKSQRKDSIFSVIYSRTSLVQTRFYEIPDEHHFSLFQSLFNTKYIWLIQIPDKANVF